MKSKLFLLLLIVLGVSCAVFPNSLKLTSAGALVLAALFRADELTRAGFSQPVLKYWILGIPITVLYVVVGQLRGAPSEAAVQVLLIYILFPILWISVVHGVLTSYPDLNWISVFSLIGITCCATVGVFYFLFFTYGPDAVLFFIEEPNIDTEAEGYIGATMYVFGTLIFTIGGYIASFDAHTAKPRHYLVLLTLVFTALVSGRSALQLSVFVGAVIFGINLLTLSKRPLSGNLMRLAILLFFFALLILPVMSYFGLDLTVVLGPLLEKLATLGGEGRMQQFDGLREGVVSNWGLGVGHGVGVFYTVSDEYPWRYEMVWMASLHRVGIVGAVIYFAPFLAAFGVAFSSWLNGRMNRQDLFMLGAYTCAFLASNTNPYIEALVFQWMYVLPVMYFLVKPRIPESQHRLVGHLRAIS